MRDDVSVRRATEADREAIASVHRESIRSLARAAYDDEVVDAWVEPIEPDLYELPPDAGAVVVAERSSPGDAVVGYGDVRFEPPSYLDADADGELRAVYVGSAHARRGVGTAILDRLEELAADAGCESLGALASINARAFYESRGWRVVRECSHEFGGAVEAPALEVRTDL